jgi:hypothetical protein
VRSTVQAPPAPYALRIRLAIAGVAISWTLSILFFYLGWRTL